MKKFFAIFTAVILMPGSQLMAWDGGPFSNDNALPGGDDGIYEAMATMTNGVGLYRFAVRNNGASTQLPALGVSSNVQFNGGILGAQSSNVWYYKGITYYGVAFGMASSKLGIVSCVAYASSNTQGVQQGGGVAPNAAGINGIINVGPSGGNVKYANSNFIARMRDKGPAFRFDGSGQISFVGNVDETSTVEATNPTATTLGTATAGATFTPNAAVGPTVTPAVGGAVATILPGSSSSGAVTGNRIATQTTTIGIAPNTATITTSNISSPSAATNQIGFNSSTHIGTGGETSTFSQKGHVRKFLVFGSKVSHVVAP